jgi:hypothetical protein
MTYLLHRRVLLVGLVCLFLWAGNAPAAERLTVAQLQKYHESYQMHAVTVVGRVQNMNAMSEIEMSKTKQCSSLYGVAQFELVDDTGTLQAEIVGSCASSAMKLPGNGDVIELTAKIQVFPSKNRTQRLIKAVAQDIVVLKPAPQNP